MRKRQKTVSRAKISFEGTENEYNLFLIGNEALILLFNDSFSKRATFLEKMGENFFGGMTIF